MRFARIGSGALALGALACSASSQPISDDGGPSGTGGMLAVGGNGTGGTAGSSEVTTVSGSGGAGGTGGTCGAPPNPAGPTAVLAPAYAPHYQVYDLGPVPGVPEPLGGCVIKHDDPNTLLIAGASETPTGKIYSIGVVREPCGHIVGFNGVAQPIADTPYVDANLVYTPADLMFYTQWPTYTLSQLLPGSTVPDRDIDLIPFGIETLGDSGAGGVGFVPSGASAGEMRIVTWPGGRWYHVDLAADGNLYQVTSLTLKTQLPNNPGGFAYVPAGSPGFPSARVLVAEWSAQDRVATYAIDAEGDPIPSTRDEFLIVITRPWGAYHDEVTGDLMFLQWGGPSEDRVYIVQGFIPPPEPPPPPPPR